MTTPASGPVPASPTKAKNSRRRLSVLGVSGELLITVGVLLLLFVVWQLWWTDILSARQHAEGRQTLLQEWGLVESSGEKPKPVTPKTGKAFGLIYIPEIKGRAWGVPLVEGTTRDDLMKGFGHHPKSALPGQLGNFAMAAHRTTYGAPLHNIDTLKKGDEMIVETNFGWYTYELTKQKIIKPWEGWILDPIPGLPRDETPTEALMTMYSCHPKFSAAERYVWFGKLVEEMTKADGQPAAIEKLGKT